MSDHEHEHEPDLPDHYYDADDLADADYPTDPSDENQEYYYEIPSFLDILLDADFRTTSKAPPMQIGECQQDRDYIDHLLRSSWDPADSRALLNKYGDDSIAHKELTYGEITATGVRQLMEDMDLLKIDTAFGKIDIGRSTSNCESDGVVFYDLGSGEGKLVVQLWLETLATSSDRIHLQKVVGVELSQARHEMAVSSWKKLQRQLLQPAEEKRIEGSSRITNASGGEDDESMHSRAKARLQAKLPHSEHYNYLVEFVNSNILEYDYSDATHVFASSIFFPSHVSKEMSRRLHQNAIQHGTLKVVAALSDLELLEQGTPCFWEKRTQRLQMSWGGCFVRLYVWKNY